MLYLVDYPPRYINWAAPTIDIFNLFVDYPPMNINWATPTIDIFKFGLSSDNYYF